MKRYVIVGNGVAAAGCIEGIRSADPEGAVTVVSAEKHAVYCRPLISYYLEGKTDPERMRYRDPGFYERMGAEVLYGRRGVGIDAAAGTLALDDGSVLPYDALCIATGSSPFVPAFEGLDSVKNRFTFMTLDDAMALDRAVRKDSRVLIVGAGLIGLKCAEGLRDRTAEVTVCDLADRILSSILDGECAALMQRRLEEHGIRFLLGDSAVRFAGSEATMRSGATVPFDILVLAVGVRANTSLMKEAGGAVDRGILVDSRMQTSIPGVYAAGDCTEGEDISSGKRRVLAILPNASFQGYTAGVNMAGGSAVFDKGIPMNSVGFFGLHAMTAGTYEGDIYEERTDHSLKRLYTEGGLLKGFLLIGCEERAGIYTSLIREKTPLDSILFDEVKLDPSLLPFGRSYRAKKLGGAV